MALLEIKAIDKKFGGLHAVNNVSFNVNEGNIKAVIGPNGAGKTTLFNLVSGALPIDSGAVSFSDTTITGLKPYQIARKGIARTFQNIKMFHGMTALENVKVGMHPCTKAGFWAGMLHLPWTWTEEKQIHKRAMELLQLLEIEEFANIEATSLAFGQQRAVEFARALASNPRILLLDEPAAGLNIYETAEVARLITKIQSQRITVLLVEHDMSLVMDISDEIVVLSFGEKIAEGTPGEIQHNEDVIKIYLGE